MVKKILSKLTNWLTFNSQPFQEKKEIEKDFRKSVTVQEALNLALSIKLQSDSERTRETFQHQAKMLTFFLVTEKLHTIQVRDFTKLHALSYLDHLTETRSLSNTSWNNYLTQSKSLFSELIEREIIDINPFTKIKYKEEKQTKRRPFTPEEAHIIATHIEANYPMLFLAIVLEHYCLIRPAELRRLKLNALDFSKSIIRIEADISKTNTERVVTVPRAIWQYLLPFAQYPTNFYLFGENLKPNPFKQCGEKTLSNTHRLVLKRLQERGELHEIDTLCLYSWKYLGIKEYAEMFGILAAQNQSGHKTDEMTKRYYRADEVDKNILNLKIENS